MGIRSFRKLLWLLPVLLALAVNFNVLQNGLGWDDENIIRNLKLPDHWWGIFLPESGWSLFRNQDLHYLRPVVSSSYLLDLRIWGKNPFGFHLSVWLVHALNTALVYFLAGQLTGGQARGPAPTDPGEHKVRPYSLPLVAALLFAVHPIHAESVAWIAGRSDVLCAAFVMASFIAYIRFMEGGGAGLFAICIGAFLLSLLSKETGIGLLPVFLAYDYFREKYRDLAPSVWIRKPWLRWAVLLVAAVVYLGSRQAKTLNPLGRLSPETAVSFSPLKEAFLSAGLYLKMMVFPYPHLSYIATLPESAGFAILSVVLIVLFSAALIAAVIRRCAVPGIGLVWTGAFLAPAVSLALIQITPTAAAERYVYLPTIGLVITIAWAAASGMERLASRRPGLSPFVGVAGFAVLIVWVGVWGLDSHRRNAVWRNSLSFWMAGTRSAPEAGYPQLGVGVQYAEAGQYAPAESAFRTAIRLDEARRGPDDVILIPALQSLAQLYFVQKRYADAEPLYRRVLSIREKVLGPDHPFVPNDLNNLAVVEHAQSKFAEAESLYRRAVSILEKNHGTDDPSVAVYLIKLGDVLSSERRYDEAEPLYRRALAIRKDRYDREDIRVAEAVNKLGLFFMIQNKPAEAVEAFGDLPAPAPELFGQADADLLPAYKNYLDALRESNRREEADRLESRLKDILQARNFHRE
jgi:tetratricopeptide (TPR) repeat protein